MQILFLLDVRTVALFVAMTFFVQATAIGAQAFLIRELRQYRGVSAAVLANLCVAVGLVLRLFVGRLSDFITTILASTLILTGPGLFYIALGQFTGLTYSKTIVINVITAILSFLLYFTYWNNLIGARMITLSLGAAVMVLMLIYQLWRTRRTSLRFSADLMLISFLTYGLFLIGRSISIALAPPQDLFSNTPIQSATYLLLFAMSFFWSTGFILMVSERLHNDLMEVATIDVLTRIPNRRATQGFLEKELSRIQRSDGEFGVLLIDLDNFKQVNDRWGHAMGDQVLVNTASIFQSMLRKQDWVGRWGGEEFLIILPGSCDAALLAERVRCQVANSEYGPEASSFHITVSIGVACANQKSTVDGILKKADDALYEAKLKKNTVSVAI
ncbi:MAG TPA: GGDEF domain-containing protein [Anaerolineales bacterium]|nr:GGDEF domain-containing protein [Anaerolineales bacterium]HLO30313.1 GGDEF domain-containing protein [Anaerolineales bacterium]